LCQDGKRMGSLLGVENEQYDIIEDYRKKPRHN
jgi:hypothetical protein